MSDRLALLLQHLLPKQSLTRLAGHLSRTEAPTLLPRFLQWYVKHYRINMNEALQPDLRQYRSFEAFFTRLLQPGARPLANADFLSPVDGTISQFGPLADGQILQAKGHHYSLEALVAGDPELTALYRDGQFATIYLSPADYHRIHMPCDGRLLRMTYVPGTLFSVSPVAVRGIPDLFARNERLICHFDSDNGPFTMILVGATIVGSIVTSWHGVVNGHRDGQLRQWRYDQGEAVRLAKGAEMGQFRLGSTVIMLHPDQAIRFNPDWQAEHTVKVGSAMGSRGSRD